MDNEDLFLDDEFETDDGMSETTLDVSERLVASYIMDKQLPLHFKTTVVKFSHASIRDFLLKQGLPNLQAVGFDAKIAELHITQVCLSLLANRNPKFTFEISSLSSYAAQNFGSHLASVDPSTMSSQEKLILIRQLCDVFSARESLLTWRDSLTDYESFFNDWFGSDLLAQCVCGWLSEVIPFEDSLDENQQQFLATAAVSAKKLFEPFAKVCTERWLASTMIETDVSFDVWFLHIYERLVSTVSRTGKLKGRKVRDANRFII